MNEETKCVTLSHRASMPGVTTGCGVALEIEGVEIPNIESIEVHPITPEGLIMATVTLCIRLGK